MTSLNEALDSLHCLDLQLLHLWLVPLLVLACQALLHLSLLVRILDLHDPVLNDNWVNNR